MYFFFSTDFNTFGNCFSLSEDLNAKNYLAFNNTLYENI
ncbi:hypothetical protein M949_1746 [Riemerella anatipestifer CH3]|nr:hypothetical protein M949_1746 [Riemerella anatipestifer CH3]